MSNSALLGVVGFAFLRRQKKTKAVARTARRATTAITMPAVAPLDRADFLGEAGGLVGEVVEEARDAGVDVSGAVVVADVGVEVGTEDDDVDEGKSWARSKTRDVAEGEAEEREE